ncbi:MAG: hypothetical protein ACLFV0_11895, partial [Nitriliruptoraceae bacterium]
ALEMLCTALRTADAEVVTLLHGAATDVAERRAAVELVRRAAPGAELEELDAGVAPARYWLGVE